MKQAFIYSLKVWFTVVVISPLLLHLLLPHLNVHLFQVTDPYHYMFLLVAFWSCVGLILLLPLAAFIFLRSFKMSEQDASEASIKGSLYPLAFALAILPNAILLVFSYDGAGRATIGIIVNGACYGLVSLFSVWFYKLKPGQSKERTVR